MLNAVKHPYAVGKWENSDGKTVFRESFEGFFAVLKMTRQAGEGLRVPAQDLFLFSDCQDDWAVLLERFDGGSPGGC